MKAKQRAEKPDCEGEVQKDSFCPW